MSNIFGKNLKVSIFGESHGKCVGVTIDGLPAGFKVDFKSLEKVMEYRRPGSYLTSGRKESDKIEFISGIQDDVLTGTPLTVVILNENQNSNEYNRDILRPSHADLSQTIKYNGFSDMRGGGYFSGRLTAPLTAVGEICRQILKDKGIYIVSHIKNIGNLEDGSLLNCEINNKILDKLDNKLPLLNLSKEDIYSLVSEVNSDGDSVGGSIECVIYNIKPGIGSPFFDSVESNISKMMFSIPSIKAIEFGAGFEFCSKMGSQVLDTYYYENNKLKQKYNYNGGIIGGITNGQNIIFKVAVKPTPTIKKEINTVNIKDKKNVIYQNKGRHDPCIALRMPWVIQSSASIVILDMIGDYNYEKLEDLS